MKTLAIIGARGQLGSDLSERAAEHGFTVLSLGRPEGDVTDPKALARIFEARRPEAVVNTAAFHVVDRCESESAEAFAVNALGARNAARAAKAVGARFLHLSTDYVFHGDAARQTPFTENDRPAPASVYAASKLAGEHLLLAAFPEALVVRTCGLYGLHPPRAKGDNFPQLMIRLAKSGKPLRVVADQICTPTFTRHLAEAVFTLLDSPLRGVVHVTDRGACSWYEFARTVLDLAGIEADLAPVTAEEYGAAAPRPPYSVLENKRLAELCSADPMPRWPDALEEYLKSAGLLKG